MEAPQNVLPCGERNLLPFWIFPNVLFRDSQQGLIMDDYELFMMPGPSWPYSWISITGDDNEEEFLNDVSKVFQDYGFRDWATEYFMQNRY